MAPTLAEADEMMAVSKSTGQMLAVFQNRRYSPAFRKAVEIIESGVLGRVFQISMIARGFGRRWDWQTLQKHDGGTLNNTGPHVVDQAVVLLHERTPEVWAHMDRVKTLGDADDHVKVLLRAPGEPVIDIEITSGCAYTERSITAMGPLGALRQEGERVEWKYVDADGYIAREVDERPVPDRSYNREDVPWQVEATWEHKGAGLPVSQQFYVDLYETITTGAPLVIVS